MDRVRLAIERTIGKEGKYANHPSDRGGETMWGITEATARRHNYFGPMKTLPRDVAIHIYLTEYYTAPNFGRVADIHEEVGYRLFDAGVLCGPEKPSQWFQMSLNLFNKKGSIYPDIATDGIIGEQTLSAFNSFMAYRSGEYPAETLLSALEALFGHYLFTISGNIDPNIGRQANEDFTYGWFRHRVNQ